MNQGPLLLSPSGNLRQPAAQMHSLASQDGEPMEVVGEERNEVSLSRGLFGGAIEVELPMEFEDISTLRDVLWIYLHLLHIYDAHVMNLGSG